MKKLFILLSLVAAIGTVLAGCSSESSGAESSEGSEEKKGQKPA